MSWSDVGELFPTAISILVLDPGPERGHLTCLRRQVQRVVQREHRPRRARAGQRCGRVTGTFVVNGSPTKTQMVDGAGGRSQLAQITTGAITVIVLLFLTKPLRVPAERRAGLRRVPHRSRTRRHRGMRRIARLRRDEFVVAVVTASTVVLIGVEQGIVLAIILSVVDHLRRSYKPTNGVITGDVGSPATSRWSRSPDSQDAAGSRRVPLQRLAVLRQLEHVPRGGLPPHLQHVTRQVCGSSASTPPGVSDIDYSAAETLRQVHDVAQAHDVRVAFAEVQPHVRGEPRTVRPDRDVRRGRLLRYRRRRRRRIPQPDHVSVTSGMVDRQRPRDRLSVTVCGAGGQPPRAVMRPSRSARTRASWSSSFWLA